MRHERRDHHAGPGRSPDRQARQRLGRRGACLLIAALLLGMPAAAEPAPGAPDRPLIVAEGDSLGPLGMPGPEGKRGGLSIDSLTAVAARAGIAIQVEVRPWPRAQAMVKQGAADLFVTVPTAEREAYALFSQRPLFQGETVVLYDRDSPQADRIAAARTLDDLKGLMFAAYLGSGWTVQSLAGQNVTWVNDRPTVLAMLAAGHADASLSDSLLSHALITAEGFADKIAAHRIDTPQPHSYHIGIRRGLAGVDALLARLDAATEAAEADGTLAAIKRRYEDGDLPVP